MYLFSAFHTGQSAQFQLFKQFLLPFQTTEDVVMLNGFGTIVNSLGKRVKPYLPQICGTILWRLNNKSAKVRQQAADLISRIAVVMKTCQVIITIKVHIFWESHNFAISLPFFCPICSTSQKSGGDLAKFCDLLRIYELY